MTAEPAECVHTQKTKTKRRGLDVCSVLSHKLFLVLMIRYSCLLLGHNKKACAANWMSILCKHYSGKIQVIDISSWLVS
jgi:hypothetical protein